MIDRAEFGNLYIIVFGKPLTSYQQEGYTAIFNAFDDFTKDCSDVTKYQLAYILATAMHEVGPSMKPLREGPWSKISKGILISNQEAVNHVTWMFQRGIISENYASPNPETHQSYYGRGFVQLTHYSNYKKMGELLGKDFVHNPDLVLELSTAAEVLVQGMFKGMFTGSNLAKYINTQNKDYFNARRIVNRLDRAAIVADLAKKFEACIILREV